MHLLYLLPALLSAAFSAVLNLRTPQGGSCTDGTANVCSANDLAIVGSINFHSKKISTICTVSLAEEKP